MFTRLRKHLLLILLYIKNIVFTLIVIVLVQFVVLAQDPGDFGGGDNPVDTPIDSYIGVMILVGLGYVFYKYKDLIKSNTCSTN